MQTTLEQILSTVSQSAARPTGARWAVKLLFFLNGVLIASWASRVPAVQAFHHLSNGALGLVLFSIAFGAVLAMPLSGWFTARAGSDKVCVWTALAYGLMLPAIFLAPNVATLVLALFCFGASHAALDVSMNAQAVAVEKRYARPIMSSFHALWSLGGLTGAALGGLLASQNFSLAAHFTLVSILFGIGLALASPHLLVVAEERAPQHLTGRPSNGFHWPSGILLALGAVSLCVMMGEGAMADWSAVYLRKIIGASEGLAAAGYATFSISMAVGRLAGDYLTARLQPQVLVRAGSSLAAVGMLLAISFSHPAVALLGFAMVGAGFATTVPIVFTAAGATRNVPPGIALASVSSLGYLGFLFGPPMIGFVAQWLGLKVALGIIVATSLLAAILANSVRRNVLSPPALPLPNILPNR